MTDIEEGKRTSSVSEPLPKDDGHLTSSLVLQHANRLKPLKPINFSILRWNLLWLFVIIAFITIPVWLKFASQSCLATFYAILGVLLWLDLVWFLALIFSIYTLIRLQINMN